MSWSNPVPHVDEDEIDLLELICTILKAWKTIVGITIVCLGLAVAYALYAPEVFKAETLLAPASEEKSGASSALSQFGGLAAMAGISIPSDSNVEQVIATLQSRKFLRQYINGKKLMHVLFEEIWDAENQTWLVQTQEDEPTEQKAVETFKSILSVDENKKSGLIGLSISWKDPIVAAVEWANDLVKQLNEQLREKAITDSQKRVGYLEQELAKTTFRTCVPCFTICWSPKNRKLCLQMLTKTSPSKQSTPRLFLGQGKPNRKLIVALGGVCGGFLGIFAVFFAQFLKKLKSPLLNQGITH